MRRLRRMTMSLATLAILLTSTHAEAGCGCEKPPPPPSQVLPHVTYAGMAVRLLNPIFVDGQTYTVTFTSGTTGASAVVQAGVSVRRDLADAQYKPQLDVALPALPLGPASITIRNPATGAIVSTIDDSQFTVAPTPIALPTTYGTWTYPDFQAAVGRDGVAYVTFDLTGLQDPMIFEAQAKNYALRFGGEDVVFYNIQGFVMQLLSHSSEPVPGMFVFPADTASADSDILHYSRHEFSTYFLQHAERLPHAVDATDPNWHLDGSRHVDHDHLILAIAGTINGVAPKAGATPTFSLSLGAHSLFHEGVVGVSSLKLNSGAVVDSYEAGQWGVGENGDVFSGGTVTITAGATVKGSVTGSNLVIAAGAEITGQTFLLKSTPTFMSVKVPAGLPDLGDVSLSEGARTIQGPGSFVASRIRLEKWSLLVIDNSEGPVTIYVTGPVSMDSLSAVTVRNPDPEQFAIYAAGKDPITLNGSFGSSFYGVIYAPQSPLSIANGASFSGAFVGKDVASTGKVHYDRLLRSTSTVTDLMLSTAQVADPVPTVTATPKPTSTPTPASTKKSTGSTSRSSR